MDYCSRGSPIKHDNGYGMTDTRLCAGFKAFIPKLLPFWRRGCNLNNHQMMVVNPMLRPKTGCCPMTSHSLSQGWLTHFNDHPMTGHRTAQTSGRRPCALTNQIWFPVEHSLTQKCLWQRTFRNLDNIMCKIWFDCIADYFCTKPFPNKKKTITREIVENFRLIASGLVGVETHFNRQIFPCCLYQILLFRSYRQRFICVDFEHLDTLHTHSRHVLYHYGLLSKFTVLFPRIDPKAGLWKIPPVKTPVAHRTAQSLDGRVPIPSVWPNPGLVRSPIGRYIPRAVQIIPSFLWLWFRIYNSIWNLTLGVIGSM